MSELYAVVVKDTDTVLSGKLLDKIGKDYIESRYYASRLPKFIYQQKWRADLALSNLPKGLGDQLEVAMFTIKRENKDG